MATKQEVIDAIADAAGVTPSDVKVLKFDAVTGSMRLEIDGLEVDSEEDDDDLDDDLDDSEDNE